MASFSQQRQLSVSAEPLHCFDIFVSHSSKQQDFARNLTTKLSSMGYSVFFQNANTTLPPGQTFPSVIFSSAHSCKLAIVAISHEFLTSQWPMTELCLFADRMCHHGSAPPFTLMPLFLKLSPEDTENAMNLLEWRVIWKAIEAQDQDGCFSAQKCEEAVKLLPRLKGIARRSESEQEEAAYIEEIIDGICSVLPNGQKRINATPDN